MRMASPSPSAGRQQLEVHPWMHLALLLVVVLLLLLLLVLVLLLLLVVLVVMHCLRGRVCSMTVW